MRKKLKLISVFAFVCAVAVLLSSCSARIGSMSVGESEIVAPENAGNTYHSSSGKTKTVEKSVFAELFIDEATFSVGVRDLSGGVIWSSLPESSNSFASSFEVTLYTKNGVYLLNTQDNSVALGKASYSEENGVLTVNYILSDSAETASKSAGEISENDVYVSFSVSYTLSEQTVYLNIDCSSVVCTPGGIVSEISVLPYFGASFDSAEDDYIFVPDGSGAVMRTDTRDAATDEVTVKVYGADPFVKASDDCASARVPVFGVKLGDGAFAAVITDGDALAEISALRAAGENPSRAWASFALTGVYGDDSSGTINFGKSYDGSITVAYKFFFGKNADYISMAAAAREEFISCGLMSSETARANESVPFFLTLVGSDNGQTLTTAQQAIDILNQLKTKGISDVTLRCRGFFEGGTAQKKLYSADIDSALGGSGGFRELYEYTSGQNYTLLLDINIFSSSKGYSRRSAASSADGSEASFYMKNSLGYNENSNNRLYARIGKTATEEGRAQSNPALYTSPAGYNMFLERMTELNDNFTSFLAEKYTDCSDGYSVNDAGVCLYSDSGTNRQESKNIISGLVRSASPYGRLTVEGGNIYTVYAADTVTGTPFDTYYPESGAYEPVPFLQAVLHGYIAYTGEATDAGNPLYRYDMLQCVEYAAQPSFEWVYNADSVFSSSGYMASERISELVDFYSGASQLLSSLSDKTIVSHEKITKNSEGGDVSGVYRTGYSDGTSVYVNYTGVAVTTPQNIVVGAYDYVKVTQ